MIFSVPLSPGFESLFSLTFDFEDTAELLKNPHINCWTEAQHFRGFVIAIFEGYVQLIAQFEENGEPRLSLVGTIYEGCPVGLEEMKDESKKLLFKREEPCISDALKEFLESMSP